MALRALNERRNSVSLRWGSRDFGSGDAGAFLTGMFQCAGKEVPMADLYAGLDFSLELTNISIVDAGGRMVHEYGSDLTRDDLCRVEADR